MDIKRVLSSFNDHKVRFIIIGATAFPAHGYDRSTQDIDLFIDPTLENAQRAYRALEAVGYDLMALPIETFLQKKTLLRQYILATDIHPFVAGASFATLWKNRTPCIIEGVRTFVASLSDLIRMKKAANRPKDREDLRYLEGIRKLERRARRKKSTPR